MIKVDQVSKQYGEFQALKEVSFEVSKGEILGFLGPNGAGKTTLMRILTGYFEPTKGAVEIKGLNIEEETIDLKRAIGYLPENAPLYTEMRVRDFLIYVARVKLQDSADIEDEVDKVIKECDLGQMERRQIGKLSKGYKQRVGLAQALIGDPDILILDEPTSGLDPKQIIEIRDLIKNMRHDKTVILSTHILPEVSLLCDRVVIINGGEIVAIDTPQNLHKKLQSDMEILLRAGGSVAEIEKTLMGMKEVDSVEVKELDQGLAEYVIHSTEQGDIRPAIAKAITKKYELFELKEVKLSLEDIFVKLVTKE